MNIEQIVKRITKAGILIAVLIVSSQLGYSQKNKITATPIKPFFKKMNFTYERNITENFSAVLDYQRSFKDKHRESGGWFGPTIPIREINKGHRFSLELRRSAIMTTKPKSIHKFYIGAAVFTGKHHISRKESSYSKTGFSFGIFGDDGPAPVTFVSGKYGEVDLISSGVKFTTGFQIIRTDALMLDIGMAMGRAWTDQEEDFLTLYSKNPTDGIKTHKFERNISGLFFEPKLSVGIAF